jgi:DNA-binding transcriptional ArsR family regulator
MDEPVAVEKRGVERLHVRDAALMRAMAHPARIAIIDHLQLGESATATELAEIAGLSPSATSYHLRALAKVGLIEEAPSRGDGRERVWRTAIRGMDINTDQDSSTSDWAASRELTLLYLDREEARARGWLDRARTEPPEWYAVTMLSSNRLLVTPEEMKALTERVMEIIEPYAAVTRTDAPPDARQVFVTYRTIPAP